jgi:regulatory protein
MAGTITALKIQKRNKERVNVYLDDTYAFAVTVLVAATLKKGQYLTDPEIERFKSQDERDKAYHQAVRFLGFRARSQQELVRYLQAKGYAPVVVTDTIDRLLEEQYLDDEAFARFWLANRERFRPRGQQALRYELRQKGIANEVIETALADVDEANLAWTAVEQKLARWQGLSEEDFRKKVLGFLSRRGFTYEIAYQVVERAWASASQSE